MLQVLSRNRALDSVPDYKPGPIGIGQDDKPPFFCGTPQEGHGIGIFENAKAVRHKYGSVHDLMQNVFIVLSFHHNGFPDFNHA